MHLIKKITVPAPSQNQSRDRFILKIDAHTVVGYKEAVVPIELLLPVFPSVFYGGYPMYLFECFEEGVFG